MIGNRSRITLPINKFVDNSVWNHEVPLDLCHPALVLLTLRQAADEVGKNKSTIHRAIKSGKLSATRKSKSSPWEIDPAELHRVFPKPSHETAKRDTAGQNATPSAAPELQALQRDLAERDRQIEQLETERRRERDNLKETIDDLRTRLDQENEERRKLTHLLTDQTKSKKSLWQQLFDS